MAYNLAELKTNLAKPPRICIYGGEGKGSGKPLLRARHMGFPNCAESGRWASPTPGIIICPKRPRENIRGMYGRP